MPTEERVKGPARRDEGQELAHDRVEPRRPGMGRVGGHQRAVVGVLGK